MEQISKLSSKANENVKSVVSKAKRAFDVKDGVDAGERSEGTLTKEIESVTSQIPSGTFLGLALGSIGISALLQLYGRRQSAQFVGQWVPTLLILGLYNKLVKLHGSE